MDFKNTVIGIELGSSRIKAVLVDKDANPLAAGVFDWENSFVNGVWTYPMDEVYKGIQVCYADLKRDVKEKFGENLTEVGAIGVSAMMHGYLPFDENVNQLAEFRTWRNTMTGEAAEKLTNLFGFNIPQRWSIAHLYQAILNKEDHLPKLAHLTTLAGYVHYKLTGQWVMGVGEASGMFPIDSTKMDYNQEMLDKFDAISGLKLKLRDLLPKVVLAGEDAGCLTKEGALFLDPTGELKEGIKIAPCEGDAGTGMVATNAVRPRTGNVSAGTSDFAMIVTEHELGVHREIDMVTTPAGMPVAMVHCNNCTSDLSAYVGLFKEFAKATGVEISKNDIYVKLLNMVLEGDPDCGGLISYNYYSGEGVTDIDKGVPIFVHSSDANMNLANFMRTHMLSALATLKIGLDLLAEAEHVEIDKVLGHGGYFKTPVVGQKLLSAAMNAPVSCMETAGEGGPYGMALLCSYLLWKDAGESLEDYLDNKIFKNAEVTTIMADQKDIDGFNAFLEKWKRGFDIEKKAVEVL